MAHLPGRTQRQNAPNEEEYPAIEGTFRSGTYRAVVLHAFINNKKAEKHGCEWWTLKIGIEFPDGSKGFVWEGFAEKWRSFNGMLEALLDPAVLNSEEAQNVSPTMTLGARFMGQWEPQKDNPNYMHFCGFAGPVHESQGHGTPPQQGGWDTRQDRQQQQQQGQGRQQHGQQGGGHQGGGQQGQQQQGQGGYGQQGGGYGQQYGGAHANQPPAQQAQGQQGNWGSGGTW